MIQFLQGHSLEVLKTLPSSSVQCCITSPPYYGLRAYGTALQIWGGQAGCEHDWIAEGQSHSKPDRSTGGKDAAGSGVFIAERGVQDSKTERGKSISFGATCATCEPTPQLFIANLVEIFREVRRVLKDDGTLWLNLGDSYAGSWGAQSRGSFTPSKTLDGTLCLSARQIMAHPKKGSGTGSLKNTPGMKNKDLMMLPQRVAMALQADGWYLRSQIPWIKRNVMPESVNDRPTTACEYVFLLTKSETYFYDKLAVMIPASRNSHARLAQDVENQIGAERANGGAKTNGNFKAVCSKMPNGSNEARKLRAREGTKSFPSDGRNGIRPSKVVEPGQGNKNNSSMDAALAQQVLARNRRNYDWFIESWQGMLGDDNGEPLALIVNSQPYREAHFATFPKRLVEPMLVAGTRPGDTVLDPFGGAGTVGLVAIEHGRKAQLIELNPEYIELARKRCEVTIGLGL